MERSYEEQTMFERSSSESEHVSSRSFSPEREAQKRSLYLDVDAMLLDRSSDSSVSEWAPDPAEVAKQALKDRAAAAVANRTGLSAAVAGTLLAEREWDLAGVLAEHAPRQGAPAGGAVPRDGAQGWRRYSLRELAAGEEAIDDVASGEEAIDDVAAGEEALGGAGAAAAAAAARRRGVRTLRCEMRPTTAGTAAMGVMFDIEAVGADVMVVGLAVCTDTPVRSRYSVWAAEGSWLDPGFETCTTRAKWALVMRERDMVLADNPLLLLPDGNVRLSAGNYTRLPFGRHPVTRQRLAVRIRCGERRGFYVHGRAPGSVLYRHLIRDLNISDDLAFEQHRLIPLSDTLMRPMQYTYHPQSSALLIDADDNIQVFSGKTVWGPEPFSTYDPLQLAGKAEDPEGHPACAFTGLVEYCRLGPVL